MQGLQYLETLVLRDGDNVIYIRPPVGVQMVLLRKLQGVLKPFNGGGGISSKLSITICCRSGLTTVMGGSSLEE